MRLLLAGGGTAGHISPGLAVAERLLQQDPAPEVHFVCSERALDARMLSSAGLPYHPLPCGPFPYGVSPAAARAGLRLLSSVRAARRLLMRLRPEAVLGVGGFVSVPVVIAARLAHLPVAIHVLDAQPDRANRLASRWSEWITLAFAEAARHFPSAHVEVTGCPVRRRILEAVRPAALEALGLDPAKLTLLVMGGSQGARRLNQALVGVLPQVLGTLDAQVLHLTGERDYEQVLADSGPAAALHGGYQAFPFAEDMGSVLAAADLVISRAGSSSLAETAARGCPQILVPYPHAGGHQMANAQALARAGAAVVLPDEQCEPAALLHMLTRLLRNEPERLAMSRAAYRWASPHAAKRLAEGLRALVRHQPPSS